MKQQFELKQLASTAITDWYEIQRMAVLDSGNQIFVYGRKTESSTFSLCFIKQSLSGEVSEEPVNYPCEHVNNNSGMFVVIRDAMELILVSCRECRNIKLLDPKTMQVKSENKISKHYKFDVFCVWPGPDDTVFVISKDGEIWHLDSSFIFIEKFKCKLGSCESVSSLPDVLAVRHQCQIKAVSIPKGKELWVKKGKQRLPKDLCSSPRNNVLVVSDQKKPQIHVLNPTNGKVSQTIEVPNCEAILAMCLQNDQITIVQRVEQDGDRKKVLSHCSLVPKC